MARATAWILVAALGCDLSEQLEGEPCDVADDCSHKQTCARTDAERELDLPGICAAKGVDCVEGQQLGCDCVPDDYELDCTIAAAPSIVEYPSMTCEPTQRVCVVQEME
jgi:hypothetical protein